MKKLNLWLLLAPYCLLAQVGINTTTPSETLHVNGTFRVENVNSTVSTKLIGSDDNGVMNNLQLGTNLSVTSGELNAFGSSSYGIVDSAIPTGPSNEEFDDVDLQVNGTHRDKTIFNLTGRTSNYIFTGIAGGTDGRHILLINIPSVNFRINNEDTSSLQENRVITLSGNFVATSGQGTAELVYNGTLQRWILVNFRD